MAQIELSVLGELKTSTRQHKLRWEKPSQNGDSNWTADVGQYEFILMREDPNSPHLRIMNADNEVAIIYGRRS